MPDIVVKEQDYLEHYGILRKSGRYPWGSGEDEVTRSRTFLGMVEDLRKKGFSETDIAKAFDEQIEKTSNSKDEIFNSTKLRATKAIALNQKRASDAAMAQRLKDHGYSNVAIAQRMGLAGESSVRALLDPGARMRNDQLQATADMLRDQVKEKTYVDVGVGTELSPLVGVSRSQMDTAISMLESEGYSKINVQIDQVGTGNKTLTKVLCPPGMTPKEHYRVVVQNKDLIKSIDAHANDDGVTFTRTQPPVSISSKRVKVRYAEEGGTDADGTMYIRPNVPDLDLGGSHYAQVRIAVDGTHYLKGMAIYKKDLPEGVDVVFNTNKSDTGNKLDAMKKMTLKEDGSLDEFPFGAVIKPGGQRGVLNIVNEEGDWDKWSKSLASQMLSKQRPTLAKEQLEARLKDSKRELDEINALTNPAVKRKLLESYADGADASAVHLKAKALPGQRTQVIIPIPPNKISENEVYAPNFNHGDRVVLVRYPHGGIFEIPELVVNNNNPAGKALLGPNAKDAIGISPKVAERLSGADFDGDTVLVIPNNAGKVKSKPALQQLKDFDPKRAYPHYEGMTVMKPNQKQKEMGQISNLITDMTIKGANDSEIARAVRHSMVVIDAEKHKLNWKQSAIDNGIAQLKTKYQGGPRAGSTTLISQTTSDLNVPKRKQSFTINPVTGEKVYKYTGESYVNKKGQVVQLTTRSTKGAETKDANDLSSGTPIEQVYASYANSMKGLANQARLAQVNTKSIPYSPSASKVYANEVRDLNANLRIALRNAPRERQAQIVANAIIKQKREANPDMDSAELKKLKGKALTEARVRMGASKAKVPISDAEWEAIQAGAISNERLEKILDNTDLDRIKALATPREPTVMTSSKQSRARLLMESGRTAAEVAQILGVSVSTLKSSLSD